LCNSDCCSEEENSGLIHFREMSTNSNSVASKNPGKGSVVEKDGTTTTNVMLHALVLINISDHWTRTKVQNNAENPRVLGALLGTQSGRNVEVFSCCELVYNVVDGLVVIDQKYLLQKQEQLKLVFKNYDFLGWYSTGDRVSPADIEIHKQLLDFNESPLYLLLDTVACARPDTKDLPVHLFDTELRLINDQPTQVFAKVPYRIETGDAERVSVDHVARITPSGTGSGSMLTAHLLGVHNAISMLNMRIKILLRYLETVKAGKSPIDHGLLRRIASLCNQLPSTDTPSFKHDFIQEYNDGLMITYLAAMTKGSNSINELIDKFNVVNDRSSMRRRGGLF